MEKGNRKKKKCCQEITSVLAVLLIQKLYFITTLSPRILTSLEMRDPIVSCYIMTQEHDASQHKAQKINMLF